MRWCLRHGWEFEGLFFGGGSVLLFLVTLHTIRILDLSAFRSTEAHSDPVLGLPLPLINQK